MKEMTFHFMLKALFVLKIFNFLSRCFGHAGKQLDKKAKVDCKVYDLTDWQTKYSTHTAQYLIKERQPDNEIWSVNGV